MKLEEIKLYNSDTADQYDEYAYQDGYRDGQRYHMDFDTKAKNWDRYRDDPNYRRGFDQAGEDS